MPRPGKFSRADVVDAATALAAGAGPAAVTMATLADRMGAPTGSIYHRFESRAELMAWSWFGAVASFQDGFLQALRQPAQPIGLAAAVYPVEWARSNLGAAMLVVCYRRQDFAPGPVPNAVRPLAERLATELDTGLSGFAGAAFGDSGLAAKQRAAFLLLDLPAAAMRRFLAAGLQPPPAVEDLVREAFVAMTAPPRGRD